MHDDLDSLIHAVEDHGAADEMVSAWNDDDDDGFEGDDESDDER